MHGTGPCAAHPCTTSNPMVFPAHEGAPALFTDPDMPPAEAAVRYATAGVPVLPLYEPRPDGCACGRPGCDRPGKHPRLPRGVHQASTDPDTVARWWRWWPHASVGAATGHAFDVWDIDLPTGAAARLLADHLADTAAPLARTGSGGTHVFVAATGHGNRAKFLPGCDWRGRGGYVVLPPSRHVSGQPYRWLTPPLPFPPAPTRLLAAVAPQPLRATPARGWHANARHPYAEAALRRECERVAGMAPDSGRNNALNRAAFNLGQLVAGGVIDAPTAETALADAARACGLGDREAARTIASGLAAGQRHPRTRRGAA